MRSKSPHHHSMGHMHKEGREAIMKEGRVSVEGKNDEWMDCIMKTKFHFLLSLFNQPATLKYLCMKEYKNISQTNTVIIFCTFLNNLYSIVCNKMKTKEE